MSNSIKGSTLLCSGLAEWVFGPSAFFQYSKGCWRRQEGRAPEDGLAWRLSGRRLQLLVFVRRVRKEVGDVCLRLSRVQVAAQNRKHAVLAAKAIISGKAFPYNVASHLPSVWIAFDFYMHTRQFSL